MLDSFHAREELPTAKRPRPHHGARASCIPSAPVSICTASSEGCSRGMLLLPPVPAALTHQLPNPPQCPSGSSAPVTGGRSQLPATSSCCFPRLFFFFLSFFIFFYAACLALKHPSGCQPPPASPREGCRMLDSGHQPRQRQEPGEVSVPPCHGRVDAGGPSRPRSQRGWKREPLEKIALQRGTYLYIFFKKQETLSRL